MVRPVSAGRSVRLVARVGSARARGARPLHIRFARARDRDPPGRQDGLAVCGNQKHSGLQELPTLDEAGIPVRTQRTSSWGLFGPKGIPTEVDARLVETLNTAMARPEILERFRRTSTLPDWRSPADLRAAMDSDYRCNGELLPAIGFRPEGVVDHWTSIGSRALGW
jgi:hypothetical protein